MELQRPPAPWVVEATSCGRGSLPLRLLGGAIPHRLLGIPRTRVFLLIEAVVLLLLARPGLSESLGSQVLPSNGSTDAPRVPRVFSQWRQRGSDSHLQGKPQVLHSVHPHLASSGSPFLGDLGAAKDAHVYLGGGEACVNVAWTHLEGFIYLEAQFKVSQRKRSITVLK